MNWENNVLEPHSYSQQKQFIYLLEPEFILADVKWALQSVCVCVRMCVFGRLLKSVL